MKTVFIILLILALELAFCAWLGRGSVPPLPFEGDAPTITPPPLPFSDLAIPHAQPLSVIALPEPHGYLRPPVAPIQSAVKSVQLSFAPSLDTNVVAYEIAESPVANGIFLVLTNIDQRMSISFSNRLNVDFFQAVSVNTDGFNSLGNYQ